MPLRISFHKDFDGICGITQQEILDYFMKDINDMSKYLRMSVDECLSSLAHMYNGYHFCANGIDVYNPNSLCNAELNEYWFEASTPTFLVQKLKQSTLDFESLNNGIQTQIHRITHYIPHSTDLITLLFFSGYLTIKDYDPVTRIYTLGYPNTEVKDVLVNYLLPYIRNE